MQDSPLKSSTRASPDSQLRLVKPTAVRKDIQGLRALAVGLVIAFHLAPAALPGGYIGVDIFFVISGFLITSHLLREAQRTAKVSIVSFWARRARRLLPAALVVLLVSTLLVLFLFPRSRLPQNLWEIAFASLYVLNWNLAANSVDYLNAHNSPSIAQHYWSLSVEEQFYIVWPILLAIVIWAAVRTRVPIRSAITITLSVVIALSFTFSILETIRSQPSAYFVTTTRAWEFAAGGLIACIRPRLTKQLAHTIVSWASFGAIGACAFLLDGATPFPGWIAAIPVVATCVLLWVGDSHAPQSPQYLAAFAPVQFLGNISYSAYLWHWPLIVTFIALEGRSPGWKWMAAIAALTVTLAWLTKTFVEDPVRKTKTWLSRPTGTFASTAAGMAIVIALALIPLQVAQVTDDNFAARIESEIGDDEGCFGAAAIVNGCVTPYAMTDTVNPTVTAQDSFNNAGPVSTDVCLKETVHERLQVSCDLVQDSDATLSVVLVGDSHVDHFAAPLQLAAAAEGWEAQTIGSAEGLVDSGFFTPRLRRCLY